MTEAISWATGGCCSQVDTTGSEGDGHALWGHQHSGNFYRTSWSTWSSSASGWTSTYPLDPTTSRTPAASLPMGGNMFPTRPSKARPPLTTSRCLMGYCCPMSRKSEQWFLWPSRLGISEGYTEICLPRVPSPWGWLKVPGSHSHSGEEEGEGQDPSLGEKTAHEIMETGWKDIENKTDRYTEVLKMPGLPVWAQ